MLILLLIFKSPALCVFHSVSFIPLPQPYPVVTLDGPSMEGEMLTTSRLVQLLPTAVTQATVSKATEAVSVSPAAGGQESYQSVSVSGRGHLWGFPGATKCNILFHRIFNICQI